PPMIRVQSVQKWPDRVVYDTSHPIVLPVPPASPRPDVAANVSASAREAFAQVSSSDGKAQSADQKKPDAKPQTKRKVARRRAPFVRLVERRPQFGWFGPSFW